MFLLAAAAVSDIWPGVFEAVPVRTVERIAVVALIVILFNGGLADGDASALPQAQSFRSVSSALEGVVLILVLALVARPLVVVLTLGLARLNWAERAFITGSLELRPGHRVLVLAGPGDSKPLARLFAGVH
jgi:NhaP-type Na+/H+ and K+/H+ antiporter